jgi:hypothetical protein
VDFNINDSFYWANIVDYERKKTYFKQMKNIIITFLFLLTFTSYSQETKCSNFKYGKFKYSNPKYSEWIVVRTDSTQTEKSSISGIEIKSSIEWKSDCEYVLVYKRILNAEAKNMIGNIVRAKIVQTESDRYTCISKDEKNELELEMIKIE